MRVLVAVLCAVIGGVVGVVGYCVINLVAEPLGLQGGQGPWDVVAMRGLAVGVIGGLVGGVISAATSREI